MKKGMERLGREISAQTAKKMCFQKLRFQTKNDARDFAIRGAKDHGRDKPLSPYRCALCGLFHLTSLNKTSSAIARKLKWSSQ
jgi:hypothetical protein